MSNFFLDRKFTNDFKEHFNEKILHENCQQNEEKNNKMNFTFKKSLKLTLFFSKFDIEQKHTLIFHQLRYYVVI